jgi:hypothetical protein
MNDETCRITAAGVKKEKKNFPLVDIVATHRMAELPTKEHPNLSEEEGKSKGKKNIKLF